MRLTTKRITELGNHAWALWRTVGLDEGRAVELTLGSEIAQRTWSHVHMDERAAIVRLIRARMATRDDEEQGTRERIAADRAWLRSGGRRRLAAMPPLAPIEAEPVPVMRQLEIGRVRRAVSVTVERSRPYKLGAGRVTRTWIILYALTKLGLATPGILRMGLGMRASGTARLRAQ